jgi:hypothetical protein
LYEFSIEAGLKQRRLTGTALAHWAWVGGVVLPVSHCAPLKVGSGTGSAAAVACPPMPAGRASPAIVIAAQDARIDDRFTRVLSILSNSFPNLWMIRINVDPFMPITAIPDPGDLAKSVGGK